jgi:hypothetical protein
MDRGRHRYSTLKCIGAMLQRQQKFEHAKSESTSIFGHAKSACILYEKNIKAIGFNIKPFKVLHFVLKNT